MIVAGFDHIEFPSGSPSGFPKDDLVDVVGGLGAVCASAAVDVVFKRGEELVGFRWVCLVEVGYFGGILGKVVKLGFGEF